MSPNGGGPSTEGEVEPGLPGAENEAKESDDMTQQKREKERKKQEKAQRKRENRALKKVDGPLDREDEEELTVLDGPVYFKDFDMASIKI